MHDELHRRTTTTAITPTTPTTVTPTTTTTADVGTMNRSFTTANTTTTTPTSPKRIQVFQNLPIRMNHEQRQRGNLTKNNTTTTTTRIKSYLASSRRLSLVLNTHVLYHYVILPLAFFCWGMYYQSNIVGTTTRFQQQQQQQTQEEEIKCEERHRLRCTQQQQQDSSPIPSLSLPEQHQEGAGSSSSSSSSLLLPQELQQLFLAVAHTSKEEFTNWFDLGVPLDNNDIISADPNANNRTDNVLLLYNTKRAMPNRLHTTMDTTTTATATTTAIPFLSIQEAVEQCDVMDVLLTSPPNRRTVGTNCLALVPQYESSHVQKFMRLRPSSSQLLQEPPGTDPTNHDTVDVDEQQRIQNMLYRSDNTNRNTYKDAVSNFQSIASTHKPNGVIDFTVPTLQDETMIFWSILQQYLQSVPVVLKELQQIIGTNMNLQSSSSSSSVDRTNTVSYYTDHTVIVMVCNYGQSELLINFVCSARRRRRHNIKNDIDLSHILVFTTDLETTNIVAALGLHYYYDERVRPLQY
jgi:hypothetical protein